MATTNTTNGAGFVALAKIAIGTLSEDTQRKYSGAGGAGDDAFEYRRGSGASAIAYVFALNAAYGDNAPLTKAAVENAQLNVVEAGLWPGKTRGAAAPQIASLYGRSNLVHSAGAYSLSQVGLSRARVMLADMGVAWPAPGYNVAETSVTAQETPIVAEIVQTASEAPEATGAPLALEETPIAPEVTEAPAPKKRKGSAGRKQAAKNGQ